MLQPLRQFLPALRREIHLGGNVQLQDFVAAAVTQDANQCVVDFDKAALRRGDVDSFLNVVEQFPIPALGFAPISDVLKHVHGLQLGAAGGMNTRGRNQVGALENGMDVFVETLPAAAEGTGVWRCCGRKRFEGPHIDADQLVRLDAYKIRQGAIDAENIVLLVVHDDEIADGVKHIQPVAIRLLHPGKETGVFESDAGVTGDGAQQLMILGARRRTAIGETENADQFSRGAGKSHQCAILPSEIGSQRRSENIACGGKRNVSRIPREGRGQRLTEAAQQGLILDLRSAAHEDRLALRSLEKTEGDGTASEQTCRAQREVAHEFRQMQHGVQFEGNGDQGLGAAAMFFGLVQIPGQLQSDSNLRGQSASPADVLLVDRPSFDAVKHSKHSQHIAVGTE